MKQLRFGKGSLQPVLSGKKKITFRRYKKDDPGHYGFLIADIIQGIFADGMSILLRVTATPAVKHFGLLTARELSDNGYHDLDEAYCGMKAIYPGFTAEDTIVAIRFEVLKIEGVPVALYNGNVG